MSMQLELNFASAEEGAKVMPLGERATQPIELRYGTLATLFLRVGTSPLRRLTLPTHSITADSAASNCRI